MMKKIIGGFVCLTTILLSCKHSKEKIVDDKAPLAIGTVIKDSTAPPEVSLMKAPRKIAAPRPRIVPLKYPYGVGKPSILKYSVGDGLPQNLILDISMDKDGNVWSCGLGFLNKFDGRHFTNYRSVNGAGSGFTNKILIDHNNLLWVGNFDGLYTFNGQSFQPTPLSHYPDLSIRSLCEDKQGAIWVAATMGVFRVKNNSMKRYYLKNDTSKFNCINIYTDKAGRVLASTTKGVFEFQDSVFVPYSALPNSNGHIPVIIGKDRKQNLWFVQRSMDNIYLDLVSYDGNNQKVYTVKEGFKSKSVNELIEDKNGIIWISTSNDGIIRFDGQKFIYFTMKDGLPSNSIFRLKEDNIGNIWASTTNGIARICYGFMNYLENVEPGEQYNNVLAIGPDGYRWVINQQADHKSLIQYRKESALIYDLDNMDKSSTFQSILFDHSGTLWLHATVSNNFTEKNFKFDGNYFYEYGPEQGIHISGNSGFTDDKQGNVWVGGSGGLYKISGDSVTHYGAAQGFPNAVTAFYVDSKGNSWIGSIYNSVYKYNGKTIIQYGEKDGYKGAFVNDINEDPYGNIWFATDRSVNRFDGKHFYSYGQVQGFDNLVANITMDTANRLIWFSSINGLISLSFDNIDSSDLHLHRYYQRNGFDVVTSHIQFNKTYFDSLGMWGSSYNGPYRFDYNQVKKIKAPLLQLTNIRIDNEPVVWSNLLNKNQKDSLTLLNEAVLKLGKPMDAALKRQQSSFGKISFDSLKKGGFIPIGLALPFKNNSITFEFASLSPSFGKFTQFRYKLEGYGNNWSPYSTKDEAFFGNMREGKYTFRLQAISSTGAQSELNYSFRVLPPWQRTWWAYLLYALILISGIYLFIRWRTKALKKEKDVLEEKVTERTAALNQSLENLKATQTQLVHSEKMASLGELTAGIAHEIQNPLNFVNNFSEVSKELLDEIKEEIAKGNLEDAKEIMNDVIQNLEKINHHGKRADGIVKGMLQHSRSSSGTKELTDINALADEYLRLAYHGLRAKDKSFNATMKTDFDESLEKVNVIPQDIGRVILNLITNAFYVVNEKKHQGLGEYEPTVTVATKLVIPPSEGLRQVEIRVSDNGNGIPAAVKDKIFQPFFTTKPTGQGTGLGLSLAFDIVTKGHGGELKVETIANEGATFIIQLPIT